ncbi:MAG: hypothetical protein ACT4NK_06910, partial [Limnobacter sp.]
RCSMVNRHWRISLTGQLTTVFTAQLAAVFRSPRLQENLPLRAEQCRCCPAWATENGPDPLFGGPFSGIARLSKGSTGFLARDRNPSRSGD